MRAKKLSMALYTLDLKCASHCSSDADSGYGNCTSHAHTAFIYGPQWTGRFQ